MSSPDQPDRFFPPLFQQVRLSCLTAFSSSPGGMGAAAAYLNVRADHLKRFHKINPDSIQTTLTAPSGLL
jgi:hypothetical protein